MGEPKLPFDVVLIVSILYSNEDMLDKALSEIEREFGRGEVLDYMGRFDFSDYYNDELGTPIFRRFWRAHQLFPRDLLADIKIKTNMIEKRYLVEGKRRFNLDPGFLSFENFILATTKNYTHRIYLRDGIYADLTLLYKGKEFVPLDWTYPDYAGLEIRGLLKRERERYLKQIRG